MFVVVVQYFCPWSYFGHSFLNSYVQENMREREREREREWAHPHALNMTELIFQYKIINCVQCKYSIVSWQLMSVV